MKTQDHINFQRITQAIDYINTHFQKQPKLEEVAQSIHLSPFHFQRIFKEWAGISPKKFLQYISIEHAKMLLKQEQTSVFDASYQTGLSGTGRLHDLFIKVEGMSPGEFKNGGQNLTINYSLAESPFGDLLIASTQKGVCHLTFVEDEAKALKELEERFPNAGFCQKLDLIQQNALLIFTHDWGKLDKIKLHLKGTDFQLKVWESLLKIPMGNLATYSQVAQQMGKPKAVRAVGTAIGHNPIAYLIPCHRVIRSSGHFGQYHWGSNRKTAIIGWEGAKSHHSN